MTEPKLKPCTFCDETGEYEPFDADVELDKLYPTEQTNEEWLKSLDTEQLAGWLSDNSRFIYECGEKQITPKTMYEEDWEWWLKQPHREEAHQ